MRVGSIVFATDQGLGILAKSFFDNDVLTDVLVLRHGRRPEHEEWFPSCTRVGDVRRLKDHLDWFLSLDALLCFETPFDWDLFNLLRGKVKTVLMPMHECMPAVLPSLPDLMLCPSELDLRCYGGRYCAGRFLPVPVDVPWRKRERAEVFVHRSGNGSFYDRNGTQTLLQAMKYVKSPIKLVLQSQIPVENVPNDPRIDYRLGTIPYSQLWDDGDVFVFCERFNGLCLPLQEARAAGMLVIAGDRFPINTWLPKESLVMVSDIEIKRISPMCCEFDSAVYSPVDVADIIDWWFARDISSYSLSGKDWAESVSWDSLKEKYLDVLGE